MCSRTRRARSGTFPSVHGKGLTTKLHGEEGPADAPTEEALSGDQLLRRWETPSCQVEEEVSAWEDAAWWAGAQFWGGVLGGKAEDKEMP
jgi:hypothetical protein